MSSLSSAHSDIVILGGGIAGLWLLNRLQQQGYQCRLLEREALGSTQTVASQGMIHGGLKYALGGTLTGASEAIAAMPARWKDCLHGTGEIDLRSTHVLSEDFFLWSSPGVGARLTAFLASKSLRGRIDAVPRAARPPMLQDKRYKGEVYRLVDVVLDVPSLLETLAAPWRDRIHRIGNATLHWQRDAHGQVTGLQVDGRLLEAQRFILCAGEGNEALLNALGAAGPAMQRRPLQQVLVQHDYPHPLYGHCIGMSAQASPRLTVSSHRGPDGRWVWYLGGDLATQHLDASPEALIDIARRELAAVLPWAELGQTRWATLRVDRAEPRQQQLIKPDQAFAEPATGHPNVIAAWPTKLTLAPDLASRVQTLLDTAGIQPSGAPMTGDLPWPTPAVAPPPWLTLF